MLRLIKTTRLGIEVYIVLVIHPDRTESAQFMSEIAARQFITRKYHAMLNGDIPVEEVTKAVLDEEFEFIPGASVKHSAFIPVIKV